MKLCGLFICLVICLSACAPATTAISPTPTPVETTPISTEPQFRLELVISNYDAEEINTLVANNQTALNAIIEHLDSQYQAFDAWYDPFSGVYEIEYTLIDSTDIKSDTAKSISKYWGDIISDGLAKKFDKLNLNSIGYVRDS